MGERKDQMRQKLGEKVKIIVDKENRTNMQIKGIPEEKKQNVAREQNKTENYNSRKVFPKTKVKRI